MLLDPVYERPADSLGRGRWAAQPWMILGAAGLTVLVIGVLIIFRVRARLRARRVDEPPISSRRGSLRPPPSP